MKRRGLERHLRTQGCRPVREGANHAVWANAAGDRLAPIPRHRELGPGLARAICKQLDVPPPSCGR